MFDPAKVIFNESHWMTANAEIFYVSYLMSMFEGKKIGLIWDKHTSHYCTEVLDSLLSPLRMSTVKFIPVPVPAGIDVTVSRSPV